MIQRKLRPLYGGITVTLSQYREYLKIGGDGLMRRTRFTMICMLLLALDSGCWYGGLATDQELIKQFQTNEVEFNKLAQWLTSRPSDKYTAECQQRLAALGVVKVIPSSSAAGQEVYFMMSGTGYAVHSEYKGILRSDLTVTPLLSTLDDATIPLHSTAFRAISHGWYLYLDRD